MTQKTKLKMSDFEPIQIFVPESFFFNIDPEKSLLIEKTVRQSKIDLHICPRSRFGEIYSGLFARRGSIIGWHWSVMIWDTLKVNKVGKNGVSFRAYSFLLFSQSPIPSRSNHTLECAPRTHTHTQLSLSLLSHSRHSFVGYKDWRKRTFCSIWYQAFHWQPFFPFHERRNDQTMARNGTYEKYFSY